MITQNIWQSFYESVDVTILQSDTSQIKAI